MLGGQEGWGAAKQQQKKKGGVFLAGSVVDCRPQRDQAGAPPKVEDGLKARTGSCGQRQEAAGPHASKNLELSKP